MFVLFAFVSNYRFAEAMVLFVFCVIVALWLFRDPPNIDGWGRGFYDAVE